MSKISIIFSLLGMGGMAATAVGGSYLFKDGKVKKPFDWLAWARANKHDCYKWIYYGPNTDGELKACVDKRITSSSGTSLAFYLWWLKKGDKLYNRHLEVESITVESSGSELSFVFKNSKYNTPERKLKIPVKAPHLKTNLSNLNGQSLKTICKLSGSQLTCTPTSGSTSAYTVSVRQVDSYFEMK